MVSGQQISGERRIRAVVTGLGIVSAAGVGSEAFWNNLIAGKSAIDYLRAFPSDNLPCKLAAEITNFDARAYVHDKKFLKVMSRDVQLGVSAAAMAVTDSGLEPGAVDPGRLGVEFGAGRISSTPQDLAEAVTRCSTTDDHFQFTRWGEDSMGEITPLWLLQQLPNMAACHVSLAHDAQGPNNTITSRDASAILALSEAVSVIERGAADCMIVGACGSCIHPVDITKLSLFEGLSRRDDDPQRAYRPFDFQRDGTIVGEGSAAFVVEDYDHAVRRGAHIYGELLGIGAGCDGRGYSNGAAGKGLVRAIHAALKRADVRPEELGHINAHGKSTQRDDLVESRAYHQAFGSLADQIPVTALKSYFGDFDAGSGAVELAGSLLALQHGQLPRTLNYEIPDPRCRLNVVRDEPLQLHNGTGLSVNRTKMGQSVAAIFRAV